MELKSEFEDDIFKIPSDKVRLPSEAKLYTSIPPVVDVEYMTTKDENILYSNNLMNNGTVFKTLAKAKILDKNINVDDLLIGDYNQILIALRKSAYGEIYDVNTLDPDTNTYIRKPINLDELERVGLGAQFDEKGEFEFVLPAMNKRITFKLLTVGTGEYVNTRAEASINKANGVIPYITTRLETQIQSVEGNRDKIYISKFVNVMLIPDRLALVKYIDSIEPGVKLKAKFKSSIKGVEYEDNVTLGLDFFYSTILNTSTVNTP